MFTGIIKTLPLVKEIKSVSVEGKLSAKSITLEVARPYLEGLEIGASCAVNGVCLTVAHQDRDAATVSFDLSTQTLHRSTLKHTAIGDQVHFERSLKVGDEQGGHFLSGHIEGVGVLVEKKLGELEDVFLTFEVSEICASYLFDRGYIGVHGVSLTPYDCSQKKRTFSVNLIPETLKRTCFQSLELGDEVNLEIDHQTKVLVEVMRGVVQRKSS